MKALLTALLFFPAIVLADASDQRTITLTGYGEVKVKPDSAELNLRVMATEPRALDAKKSIDKRVDDFLDALRSKGVSKSDVVASGISSRPNYGYHHEQPRNYRERPLEPRKVINSYTATRTLTVTVRKLDKLGEIMESALEHDIEGIDHIRYLSSKADEHQAKAQQLAIEHSRQQARKLASAYGAQLGQIRSINYHRRHPDRFQVAQVQHVRGPHHGAYLPQQLTFSDSINVTFKLQ